MKRTQTFDPKRRPAQPPGARRARSHTSGATIGDGMRTTARWGGALALATLLLKIGPALAAALFALVFFFRSMMLPTHQPPGPDTSLRSTQPAYVADARLPRGPILQSSYDRTTTINQAPSPLRSLVELHSENVESFADLESEGSGGMGAQFVPPVSIDSMFGTLAPPADMAAFGNRNARPEPGQQASAVELSTLFESRRGRTFAGTAQMPGYASQRVRLSIDSIRDGGSHIKARLSTLEGRRITKSFVGYLQNKPDQLVLKPDIARGNIPMFLTHASWQICQTAITLEMSPDGQFLAGTSVSGEQFQFTPQVRIPPPAQHTEPNQTQRFASSVGLAVWRLITRNSQAVADDTWELTATDDFGGDFVWKKAESVHARGVYREDPINHALDITVQVGGHPRVYRGIFSLTGDEASVCLARQAGSPEPPSTMNAASGNQFTLRRE